MLTAIELDVFTAAGEGATAEAVAKRCGTDRRATELLLNALVALDVLRLAGFLVKPLEIEAVLDSHPSVRASQVVGIDGFGASAPAKDLFKHYGFTTERVVAVATQALGG